MLTTKEVADRLKISRSMVYALIDRKQIAVVRVGLKKGRGAIRVTEEALAAFLQARTEGGVVPVTPVVLPAPKRTQRPLTYFRV